MNLIRLVSVTLLIIGVPLQVWAVDSTEVTSSTEKVSQQQTEVIACRSKNFSFSLGASMGLASGEARELVYYTADWPPFQDGDTMSELVWDLDNAVMAGGFISASIKDRLFFSLEALTRVSGGGDHMTDKDWLIVRDEWSHYSESPTDLEKGLIIDLQASYAFVKSNYVALRAILGYQYDNWHWKNHGGYYIYSTGGGWRNDTGTWPDDEVGIEYEQKIHLPYAGLGIDVFICDSFSRSAYGHYSYVFAKTEDHHRQRVPELVVEDDFSGLNCYMVGGAIRWQFYRGLFLLASFDYLEILEGEGDGTYTQGGVSTKYDDNAGMALKTYTGSLSLGYEF